MRRGRHRHPTAVRPTPPLPRASTPADAPRRGLQVNPDPAVGCQRWPPPMSSLVGQPLRGRCGCCRSSDSSSATPPGSTVRWHRTPRRWWRICGRPPTTRTWPAERCSTSAADPAYFADAFAARGVDYIGVEPDPREMHVAPGCRARGAGVLVRASGMALPFTDASVDVCLSSNVAEHVAVAVAARGRDAAAYHPAGALAILSYTVWLARSAATRWV